MLMSGYSGYNHTLLVHQFETKLYSLTVNT